MFWKKIKTDYVSELDQFLFDLQQSPAALSSEARIHEMNKHKRIAELRDIKKNIKLQERIWKDF